MEEAVIRADIFCTATGNADVITADHMKAMKPMSIICVSITSPIAAISEGT